MKIIGENEGLVGPDVAGVEIGVERVVQFDAAARPGDFALDGCNDGGRIDDADGGEVSERDEEDGQNTQPAR